MSYLLDSDVLILAISGSADIQTLIEEIVEDGIAISAITYMEVLHGVLAAENVETNRDALESYVAGMPILAVTTEIAARCAVIRRTLQVQGKRIRPRALDLIVAATASEYEMTLVTRNVSDYSDIDGLLLRIP